MASIIIREFGEFGKPDQYVLDLAKTEVKYCTGCWSCWIKPPGRCVREDLNEFYRAYVNADKVIIFSKISKDFVSSNLKNLFDRMLPLFLPYINYASGESMHVPRYDSHPSVEVYYTGDFTSEEARNIYEDYIRRTFYQFHSQCDTVKPICELQSTEV